MSRPKPRPRPRRKAAPVGTGRLRLIAGRFKGRFVHTLPDRRVRPMPDRTRTALFNALQTRGLLDGAHVLDGFSGSGALGLEALSRGAAHVTFLERDRDVHAQLQQTVIGLGIGPEEVRIELADTLVDRGSSLPAWLGPGFGDPPPGVVLLLDPPYDLLREADHAAFCAAIGDLIRHAAPANTPDPPRVTVVLGHDNNVTIPPDLGGHGLLQTRSYGRTRISWYGVDTAFDASAGDFG